MAMSGTQAPVIVPLAALGLVLVMIGAAGTHAHRKEPQVIVVNLVILALAAVVVWGRFGPYSFS
jgi:DoxX-like family